MTVQSTPGQAFERLQKTVYFVVLPCQLLNHRRRQHSVTRFDVFRADDAELFFPRSHGRHRVFEDRSQSGFLLVPELHRKQVLGHLQRGREPSGRRQGGGDQSREEPYYSITA